MSDTVKWLIKERADVITALDRKKYICTQILRDYGLEVDDHGEVDMYKAEQTWPEDITEISYQVGCIKTVLEIKEVMAKS